MIKLNLETLDFNLRFKRGFVSGLIAGALMDFLDYFAHRKETMPGILSIDWFWIIVTGKRTATRTQFVLAQGGHLLSTALIGAAFTSLVPKVEEKYPILQGCAWASGVWGLTQIFTRVFKLPVLSKLNWQMRVEHYILALFYGLVLGVSLGLQNKPDSVSLTGGK